MENVELPLALFSAYRNMGRNKALELLDQLGLKDKAHRYSSELSGGEKQIVAISRALTKDPLLIVGDEPLSNLDEETSVIVLDIFRKLTKENRIGILLTTTDLNYEYDADEDLMLVKNRLIKISNRLRINTHSVV